MVGAGCRSAGQAGATLGQHDTRKRPTIVDDSQHARCPLTWDFIDLRHRPVAVPLPLLSGGGRFTVPPAAWSGYATTIGPRWPGLLPDRSMMRPVAPHRRVPSVSRHNSIDGQHRPELAMSRAPALTCCFVDSRRLSTTPIRARAALSRRRPRVRVPSGSLSQPTYTGPVAPLRPSAGASCSALRSAAWSSTARPSRRWWSEALDEIPDEIAAPGAQRRRPGRGRAAARRPRPARASTRGSRSPSAAATTRACPTGSRSSGGRCWRCARRRRAGARGADHRRARDRPPLRDRRRPAARARLRVSAGELGGSASTRATGPRRRPGARTPRTARSGTRPARASGRA